MAFKIIQVPLTGDQIKQIERGVGANGEDDKYALLAEPKLMGEVLNVQVVTLEQYEILRPAILAATKLPQWKSRNGNKRSK